MYHSISYQKSLLKNRYNFTCLSVFQIWKFLLAPYEWCCKFVLYCIKKCFVPLTIPCYRMRFFYDGSKKQHLLKLHFRYFSLKGLYFYIILFYNTNKIVCTSQFPPEMPPPPQFHFSKIKLFFLAHCDPIGLFCIVSPLKCFVYPAFPHHLIKFFEEELEKMVAPKII